MKLPFSFRLILLVLILAIGFQDSYAQSSLLYKKISLSKKKYSVYELCNAIEKQVDVAISYNSDKIKSNKKIVINQSTTDVKSLLILLNNSYGIDSKMAGNHIILTPGTHFGKEPLKKQKRKKQKRKDKFKDKLQEMKTSPSDQNTTVSEGITMNADTAFIPQIISTADTLNAGSASLASGGAGSATIAGGNTKNINYESEPTNAKRTRYLKEHVIANISIFADEPYFFNVQAELGFKYVYVTAGYAFKENNMGHWRFGGGVTIPASEKVNIGLAGSYGATFNTTANFRYETTQVIPPTDSTSLDSIIITTPHFGSVAIRQNIWKAGLTVDYKAASWLNVFISPCYNSLRTAYYQNNVPTNLRSLIPEPVNIKEENFQHLRTGFNINNDFNPNQAAYNKSWFSIAVGVRIKFLAQ